MRNNIAINLTRGVRGILVIIAVLFGSPADTSSAELQLTKLAGGSVVTKRHDSRIPPKNSGSSLEREWLLLNDGSCPIELTSSIGIKSVDYVNQGFSFRPVGSARSRKATSAFEVTYLLYDVFGKHFRTLSLVVINDLKEGDDYEVDFNQKWNAPESEITKLFQVAVFVSTVREGNGLVWRAREEDVLDRIKKSGLAVPRQLEPSEPVGP